MVGARARTREAHTVWGFAFDVPLVMITSRIHRAPSLTADDSDLSQYSSPACFLHEVESGRKLDAVPHVQIKRIYDLADPADGFRVLVDRLWPRGIPKQQARLDAWARELAPSTPLRKWFHHDRERWSEFCARYREELREQAMQLDALRRRACEQPVTLLYAAKDKQMNHAAALRDCILELLFAAPVAEEGA
jgi:uncharacterized protein YeaO (DUF488 family)